MSPFSLSGVEQRPFLRHRSAFLAFGIGCVTPLSLLAETAVDFGHLSLEAESYWNGEDLSGGFISHGLHFNNDYDTEWDTWSGWSYSNVADAETRGHLNQYAAITGGAVVDSGVYGVANVNNWQPFIPAIELPAHTQPGSISITNTTYAYYSMREGDDFGKRFDVEDNDWFLLTITGKDATGEITGEIPFYLADYRFEYPDDAYIIDEWTVVDLRSLGEATSSLEFTLSSSDTGIWGMNTPAYFAVGQITLVPEDPYMAWMEMLPEDQKPPEEKRGFLDDPAGDALPNMLKYAFGLMPMVPSTHLRPAILTVHSSETSQDHLAMEFVRSKTAAVEIELAGTADLASWEKVAFTAEVVAEVDADRERVRLLSDIQAAQHDTYFLRLSVTPAEQ